MRIETWSTASFGDVSIATIDDNKLCCVEFGSASLIQKRFPEFSVEQGLLASWIGPRVVLALEKGKSYDLPISMIGSDFQKSVWKALQLIPYGQIVSYKEVAEEIGRPEAVRAVAKAIGANPIAVIIPCHRVVGNRNPDAYHWGGHIKRKLLDMEYLATHPTEIVLS